MTTRVLMHITGFAIIAFGIVGIIVSKVGATPIDAFNYFVYVLTPDVITLGTVTVATGLVVSLVVYLIDRNPSILASIAFLFVVGIFVDVWKVAYDGLPATWFVSLWVRIPWALACLVIVSFGAALTLSSGLPPSPFECLMLIIDRKVKNLQRSKMMIEGTFFMLAILLGLISQRLFEQVNVYTLVLVLTIGRMIAYFVRRIEHVQEKRLKPYET